MNQLKANECLHPTIFILHTIRKTLTLQQNHKQITHKNQLKLNKFYAID